MEGRKEGDQSDRVGRGAAGANLPSRARGGAGAGGGSAAADDRKAGKQARENSTWDEGGREEGIEFVLSSEKKKR